MFNFSFDKRTLYIIMAVMIGIVVMQYATDPSRLVTLLISAPAVLIAITFHEYAHGYVAYKLGDDTAKNQGRLSLNRFGWGKPVEIDPRNFTRKMSMEKGEALVALAGPVMNFILAFVFTLIYCAIYKFASISFTASNIGQIILLLVASTISVNIGLGVFNLIPLPPLDGSKIIIPLLPTNAKEFFRNNEQIFYIIFILIWVTGIAGVIITPAINGITNGFIHLGRLIFRI